MDHPGHALDSGSKVYLMELGKLKQDHPLEELTLTGRLYIGNFNGWSKFPNLKNLTLSIKFFQPIQEREISLSCKEVESLMNSLVKNIPQITHLSILYHLNSKANVIQPLQKLNYLTHLSFKESMITDKDLIALALFPALQFLRLANIADDNWLLWHAHKHTRIIDYLEALERNPYNDCEKYTPKGLVKFLQLKKDVTVIEEML